MAAPGTPGKNAKPRWRWNHETEGNALCGQGNYQIEDSACNHVVMDWFNMVIVKLTAIADLKDERNQWGEFDLDLESWNVYGVK